MQTLTRFALAALLLAAAITVEADGQFDPAARAKVVAPFLDAQTVAIVHVDLTRIDVDRIIDKLQELVPEADDLQEARSGIKREHAGFIQGGAKELYVVLSLADLPRHPPFGIIPHADRVDVDAFVAYLPPGPNAEVIEKVNDALFIGFRRSLERIKDMKPMPLPELADAFEAAGDTAIQFLLVPTDDNRRVVEELMPTLPKEIGGGPSTVLTRGVRWLAIGINTPPKITVQVTVQSQDAEAASALGAKWLDVSRFLSQFDVPSRLHRNVDEALSLLKPKVQGDQLVLKLGEADGTIRALLAAVTPPLEQARNEAKRTLSTNYLKQIGLAMHNFHDTHKRFPAIGTFDAAGKPLLSWRVHILPYLNLNQEQLYDQFRFDEPWDSEHNRKLIGQMPELFRCPTSKHKREKGLATYRVVVGESTVFPGREAVAFKEIVDGTSNTIMAVEVDDKHAVVWTKPEGLPFSKENPAQGLGGQFEGGFQTVFCDGSVHFLELPHDAERLRLLLMRNDRRPIPD